MAKQPANEMSSSLGESWTVITEKSLDNKCTSCYKPFHSEGSHVEELPTDKRNEAKCEKHIKEDDEIRNPPSSRSSGSDIAVIDEDDDEEREKTPCMINESLVPDDSLFSFLTSSSVFKNDDLQPKGDFEALGEDLSDFSSVTTHIREELNSEVDFNPGAKHYIHVPNARLNLALNMVVVLAVTAVLGLGVGNFIGWSTMQQRFGPIPEDKVAAVNQQNWQPTLSQISKLKKLQDELLLCIQEQHDTGIKVCLQDTAYWKEQFAQLFEENQDLQENLQKSKIRGDESDLITEASRCPNQAKGDFQNLKLDLLIDQMDHLKLLKDYEEIRMQEQFAKEKLKKLEEENEELKMKLVEEDQEDEVMLNDLEGKIQKLKDENEVLKVKLQAEEDEDRESVENVVNIKALTSLEEQVRGLRDENKELKNVLHNLQVEENEEKLENVATTRIDTLKGQIDQVVEENQELRGLIKSMQEKRVMDKASLNDQQKLYVNELKHENEDLKVEIGKMRYKMFVPELLDQETDDSDLISMQEELNNLQQVLQQEKGESKKWKQMYEEIKSKASTSEKEKMKTSKEFLPDIDWAEVVAKLNVPDLADKLGNMGTAVSQILEDIWKMNESVGQQFKDVQKDLYTKWEELRLQMEENLKAKGVPKDKHKANKKEEKMSEMLLNSMKKLYRSGVKFMFSTNKDKAEDGGIGAGKVMDSFRRIMGKLNNKWNSFKEAVAKSVEEPAEETNEHENEPQEDVIIDAEEDESTFEQNSDNESPNDNWYSSETENGNHYERLNEEDYDRSEQDEKDWFIKRAEGREKLHKNILPQDSKFTDWDLKRAKGRKRQREVEQLDDDTENDDSDDNEDDDDDYEMKRSDLEKKHKEKKREAKNNAEKMSKNRQEKKAKKESKKKENGRKKKEKSHRNGT